LIDSLQALKSANNETIAEQKAKITEYTKKLADSVREAAEFSTNNK
jgi:hypothetical protein